MSESAANPVWAPEVSAVFLRPYLDLLVEERGEERARAILESLDVTLAEVRDGTRWTSLDFLNRFTEAVVGELGPDAVLEGARRSVTRPYVGPLWPMLRLLASPRWFYRGLSDMGRRFNKVSEIEIKSLGAFHARVCYSTPSHKQESPLVCAARKEQLRIAPTIWGLPEGSLVETRCQHRGDECCEYEIRWHRRLPGLLLALLLGLGLGLVPVLLLGTTVVGSALASLVLGLTVAAVLGLTSAREASRHSRVRSEELQLLLQASELRFEAQLQEARRREAAEAELRESHIALARALRRAEEADAAKLSFIRAMSGELRAPLMSLLGMAQQRVSLPAPLERQVEEEALLTEGQALLRILDDALDYSHMRSGHLTLRSEPFDLRSVARAAWEQGGLTDGLAMSSGVPDTVRGDPVRVRQVLVYLIEQVRQGDSATLVVSSPEPDLVCFELPGHEIGLEILSGGEGDQVSRQLALDVVRHLLDLMGGSLEARRGSTFLRLPLETLTTPSSPPAERQPALQRSARVLVVEDNRVNALVARRFLERLGHEVEVAENGAAALEEVEAGAFDLVLMDCQMPVLDGFDTTRRLRERGFSLPIVALTAQTLPGDREKCLACGMDDYLAKPLRREDLAETLQRWVSSPGAPPA